jgi:hypothetical protein
VNPAFANREWNGAAIGRAGKFVVVIFGLRRGRTDDQQLNGKPVTRVERFIF